MVVWHVDRLLRSMADLEDVIDRCEHANVRLATVSGDLDLSTDAGRLVGRILASVARGEIERKSARQRRANLQRAENGKASTGGMRTLGYDPGLIRVRPKEADHIQQGFSELLAGGSLKSIARRWNTAGFTTTHGGRWDGTSVRVALRNPRFAGLSRYRGEIIGKGSWTPLVTEDIWRAAQAVLDDPERRTTPTTARRYLLAGLALCACGAPVLTGRTQHGSRTYRCALLRGHMSRAAEPVDSYVDALVVARLLRPDAVTLIRTASPVDVQALRDEAASQRCRLRELTDLFTAGSITAAQLARGSGTTRSRLASLEQEMSDAVQLDSVGPIITAPDVQVAWTGADLDIRRSVIDALMIITLAKLGQGRRGFDPATVTIEWRQQRS